MARKKTTPDNRMGVPSARAPQRGEAPDLVKQGRTQKGPAETPGSEIVKRRATDWMRWQIFWRGMMDSFEGGQRYRDAEYGMDREGRSVRMMVRHKREFPDPHEYPSTQQGLGNTAGAAAGSELPMMFGPYPGMLGAHPNATAHDDDYELRRARTPVPDFLKEVVNIHTGKIFDQAIAREGPPELLRWWKDVNGAGMPIDDWMREDISKLLLVLGCLDIVFDRPALPSWIKIETKADEIANNLDTCAAAIILPINMVWWRTDPAGNYLECLVREYWSPTLEKPGEDESNLRDSAQAWSAEFPGEARPKDVHYRHWTQDTVTLYTASGDYAEEPRPHGYPFVPIKRIFDRKRHRSPMVGAPRYEVIAEIQREYYNLDSELILSNTLQAHPFLSGDEEFCKPDQTLAIGPNFVLPVRVDSNGNATAPWTYVSPPKDPAASISEKLRDLIELKDRYACLMKPAGVRGTTGGTVSQSGYSKEMDVLSGNKVLGDIAKTFARDEREIAEFALMCILRRALEPEERAAIRITYPSRFQLKQAEAILDELTKLVNVLAVETQVTVGLPMPGAPAGATPTPPDQQGGNPQQGAVEPGTPTRTFLMPTLLAEKFQQLAKADFVGAPRELFEQIKREAQVFLKLAAVPEVGTTSAEESMAGHGTEESMAQEDRTGQAASTAVSPYTPQAM